MKSRSVSAPRDQSGASLCTESGWSECVCPDPPDASRQDTRERDRGADRDATELREELDADIHLAPGDTDTDAARELWDAPGPDGDSGGEIPTDTAPADTDPQPLSDRPEEPDDRSEAVPDLDLPAPDLPAPDLPTPDLPTPDLPTPDLPVPDGDICATALRVGVGSYSYDTRDYASDYDRYFGCGVSGGWGGDVVLVTSVPSGATLEVTVSSATVDVQAVIAEACDEIERWPLVCSDAAFSGPEQVEWTNDDDHARDHFIVADGYNFDDYGIISVSIAVAPE